MEEAATRRWEERIFPKKDRVEPIQPEKSGNHVDAFCPSCRNPTWLVREVKVRRGALREAGKAVGEALFWVLELFLSAV